MALTRAQIAANRTGHLQRGRNNLAAMKRAQLNPSTSEAGRVKLAEMIVMQAEMNSALEERLLRSTPINKKAI